MGRNERHEKVLVLDAGASFQTDLEAESRLKLSGRGQLNSAYGKGHAKGGGDFCKNCGKQRGQHGAAHFFREFLTGESRSFGDQSLMAKEAGCIAEEGGPRIDTALYVKRGRRREYRDIPYGFPDGMSCTESRAEGAGKTAEAVQQASTGRRKKWSFVGWKLGLHGRLWTYASLYS